MLLKELLKNSKKFHETEKGGNYYIDTETYEIHKVKLLNKSGVFNIGDDTYNMNMLEDGEIRQSGNRKYYKQKNKIYEVMKRRLEGDELTITEGGNSEILNLKEILASLGLEFDEEKRPPSPTLNKSITFEQIINTADEFYFSFKGNTFKISRVS